MIDIPELTKTISGQLANTVEIWEKYRRPEIINLFSEYIYGTRPIEKPNDLRFNIVEEKEFNGIRRRIIEISFSNYKFNVYGYLPLICKNKIPAFLYVMHEYQEERCDLKSSIECDFVAICDIVGRGYGVFIMPTSGIAPDWEEGAEYKKGIYPHIEPENYVRKENSWATISAWSWGASRVMDYLETDLVIDSNRITIVGHSRGGKTALWAAATDTRFFCAISNDSGCAGAAMHRTKKGEHIKDINITDWFCSNYKKFNDSEQMLPVDQHMLIASIAPRLCYVSSSSEDTWADPLAERHSCRLANEIYELYNMKGVELPDEPVELNRAYHDGNIGYHVKTGEHSITKQDWNMFLDFLDSKLKRRKENI
jgi:hypothetical protein